MKFFNNAVSAFVAVSYTHLSIGADGTIMGTSAAGLQVLGRIDLATFANSEGLMQSGNSYFTATSNSGDAKLAIAGENGTGGLKNSALEMSNVDLSLSLIHI